MNFTIFLCITLKLFSVSLVHLLAPNPGDATANYCYHHMRFLGSNATEMHWRSGLFQTALGELTVLSLDLDLDLDSSR